MPLLATSQKIHSVAGLFSEMLLKMSQLQTRMNKIGFFFILHENIGSFGRNFNEFHSFASELIRAVDVIVLAFIHTVLTKQEAASLCLSEIVTHRPMWPISQCVMHFMSLVW